MRCIYIGVNVTSTKHKSTILHFDLRYLIQRTVFNATKNFPSYRMYTKALELYPQHSSINLKYAGFLRHTRRDIPGAERYYLKAVEASPTNSDALGSYASFMHGVHNNIKEAEKYYQKAVEADDMHTNNLCNYGLFLR